MSRKNHFLMAYSGNKRTECERIFNCIEGDLKGVKTIIEPFCGSCAFSVYIANKFPGKFKYVINDNNALLIELINLSKDEDKLIEFVSQLKDLFNSCDSKEKYNVMVKNRNPSLIEWFFINKIYQIRPGLYPINNQFSESSFDSMLTCSFLSFIRDEDVTVLNVDAIELVKNYNKKNCFLFLDPPYLDSCNDMYKNPCMGVYEYLCENDIDIFKSKITLCLESNWIIKLLFKGKNRIEYDKLYQMSKKKTSHLLILNNKLVNSI